MTPQNGHLSEDIIGICAYADYVNLTSGRRMPVVLDL